MDKKLIDDLKAVKAAYEAKNKTIENKRKSFAKEFIEDKELLYAYEHKPSISAPLAPMSILPPNKPSKPIQPGKISKEKFGLYSWEFKPKAVCIVFLIIGIVLALSTFIALGNLNFEMQPFLTILFIVSGVIALLPYSIQALALLLIEGKRCSEVNKRNKVDYDTKVKNYINEIENVYPQRLEKYEEDMVQYKKDLAEYEEKLKEYESENELYNKRLKENSDIDAKYNAALKQASVLMNKYNENVVKEAEKAFEEQIEKIGLYYPMKYIYEIDEITNILVDARADSLKEAINVYEEKQYKQKMLNEQRKLRYEQEENREEAQKQCRSCVYNTGGWNDDCPSKESVSGPCPRYRGRKY